MTARDDVLVIGAGPAGVMAALRAGDLGARTTLLTSGPFGGMAANDGPVPVRTLAQAARLMREARQLGRYGIEVGAPVLDYPRLLARVDEVIDEVGRNAMLRRRSRPPASPSSPTPGPRASSTPIPSKRAGRGSRRKRSSSASAGSAGGCRCLAASWPRPTATPGP
jgi:hypothetical protein